MDQLPGEVLVVILENAEESWERRAAISTVCKRWRLLMCDHIWKEKLVIARQPQKIQVAPPFPNLVHIRVEHPTFPLLQTLHDHFHHLRRLEFGCAIRHQPTQWEEMCHILQQMAIPTVSLGSLVAWIQNPEWMVCVQNSVHVDLAGCSLLEDSYTPYLSRCETLNLSLFPYHGEDKLTDQGLRNLTAVRSLDISGRRNVSDQGLRHLSQLQALTLNRCRIAGSCLLDMPHLERLSYQRCTSLNLCHLDQLSSLTSLDMARSPIVSNDFLRGCSGLRTAHLEYCPSISGMGLQYLRNIQQLYLDGCTQLIDNSMRGIAETLQLLSVVGCIKLTCKIFEMLAHVQYLDVRKCGLITKSEVRLAQKVNTTTLIRSDFDYKISLSSFRSSDNN